MFQLLAVSVVLALFVGAGQVLAADQPNILLIVSDDQGYADLGLLNKDILTPNLDQLAKGGARLTNFYVSWPACTPSRGSLLTGRYPQRNGLYDMIRNEAPDYGKKYNWEEYNVSWEKIGGKEVMVPTKEARTRDYRAAVTCMDDSIGNLLAELGRQGLRENTIGMFFSDNGGSGGASNAPLHGHKGQTWEGGIRVPCIVSWPAQLPKGVVNDEFLSSLELLPLPKRRERNCHKGWYWMVLI